MAATPKPVKSPVNAPKRWALLKLGLAQHAWGRIILHVCCFLFRGGKWPAAKSGVSRGLRELRAELAIKLRLRR